MFLRLTSVALGGSFNARIMMMAKTKAGKIVAINPTLRPKRSPTNPVMTDSTYPIPKVKPNIIDAAKAALRGSKRCAHTIAAGVEPYIPAPARKRATIDIKQLMS